MINVTMRQLLEAGVHFGHRTRYWNPKMTPYIYGVRSRIHIINLEHTLPLFRNALKVVEKIAANRGRVLFVGTKPSARDIVRDEATRCGMPYVNYRWLGGMLTNYKTIRQSIKRLKELESVVEDEDMIARMTKKEMLTLMREKDKLSACLEGIKNMGGLPDALFIIDVGQEKIAVQEAKRLSIPVIGIVDTNTDPKEIDYIIPGNDDAQRSIHLYCHTVAEVIIKARGALPVEEVQKAKKSVPVAEVKVKKIVAKKAKVKPVLAELKAPAAEKKKPDAKKKAAAEKKTVKKATTVKKTPEKKKAPTKKAPAKKLTAKKKTTAAKKKTTKTT